MNCKRRVTKDRKLELVGKDQYELLKLRAVIRWTGAAASVTATGAIAQFGSAATAALSFPPFPFTSPTRRHQPYSSSPAASATQPNFRSIARSSFPP